MGVRSKYSSRIMTKRKGEEMCEACRRLKQKAKDVGVQISAYETAKVIDADTIKTLKAMYYEYALEILKLGRTNDGDDDA